MLTLGAVLTLTGLIATLWHVAWWIGVAFFAMLVIGQGIVIGVPLTLQPTDRQDRFEQRKRNREKMTQHTGDPPKRGEGSGQVLCGTGGVSMLVVRDTQLIKE